MVAVVTGRGGTNRVEGPGRLGTPPVGVIVFGGSTDGHRKTNAQETLEEAGIGLPYHLLVGQWCAGHETACEGESIGTRPDGQRQIANDRKRPSLCKNAYSKRSVGESLDYSVIS